MTPNGIRVSNLRLTQLSCLIVDVLVFSVLEFSTIFRKRHASLSTAFCILTTQSDCYNNIVIDAGVVQDLLEIISYEFLFHAPT